MNQDVAETAGLVLLTEEDFYCQGSWRFEIWTVSRGDSFSEFPDCIPEGEVVEVWDNDNEPDGATYFFWWTQEGDLRYCESCLGFALNAPI